MQPAIHRESLEIPFQKPFLTGDELKYVAQVIGRREIASDGYFTRACARMLQERLCVRKVLMVPSCTAALEMSAILCGIGPGDEVILPAFTFPSTANAVVRLGARPVFVDIRQDTLNLDETLVEQKITTRTKAVFPVHYAGIGCEMDSLTGIARRHGIVVVEDAAQAVNSYYRGRALGSIGHMGAYSFHATKDYTCGEGGALCINSDEFIERAEILRDKGTNRNRFLRGEVDKYTWVDIGSSYVPGELGCAYLYAQLEAMDYIRDLRRRVFERYVNLFIDLEQRGVVRLPRVPQECTGNYHMFYVLAASERDRNKLIATLQCNGIGAAFHYAPLHTSPMGAAFGYTAGELPVTEDVARRLVRLPFYPHMTEGDQERVAETVRAFFTEKKTAANAKRNMATAIVRREFSK